MLFYLKLKEIKISCIIDLIIIKINFKVENDFNKDKNLTHLIFKDGRKIYLKKAQQRRVKVVSCSWVEKYVFYLLNFFVKGVFNTSYKLF